MQVKIFQKKDRRGRDSSRRHPYAYIVYGIKRELYPLPPPLPTGGMGGDNGSQMIASRAGTATFRQRFKIKERNELESFQGHNSGFASLYCARQCPSIRGYAPLHSRVLSNSFGFFTVPTVSSSPIYFFPLGLCISEEEGLTVTHSLFAPESSRKERVGGEGECSYCWPLSPRPASAWASLCFFLITGVTAV